MTAFFVAVSRVAAQIAWYIWVIAALAITLWLAVQQGKHEAAQARLAKANAASYAQANAINYRSVLLLLAAVRADNDQLQNFARRAASAEAAAKAYASQTRAAARARDDALATLKAAPAPTKDVEAPSAHNKIRSQL